MQSPKPDYLSSIEQKNCYNELIQMEIKKNIAGPPHDQMTLSQIHVDIMYEHIKMMNKYSQRHKEMKDEMKIS